MKEIYQAILTQLLPLLKGSQEATAAAFLRHIDLDTGQLDSFEQRPPVAFPCCLVDIQISNTESLSQDGRTQRVNALVNIRLAFDFQGLTGSNSTEAHRNESLAMFDHRHKLWSQLQGFELPSFGQFNRTNERTERRPDRLKVYNTPYTFTYIEEADEAQ